MADVQKLLSTGLEEGYAGSTKRDTAKRGTFSMEVSEYTSPEGGFYRDEWIADRTGGGQELAQLGEVVTTRLYAGGTIGIKHLKSLGLIKKDVTGKLKQFIKDSGGKTRLSQDYEATDGDWQYSYKIMEHLEDIPLTVGMETINYKGKLVFAHGFLHSPVE